MDKESFQLFYEYNTDDYIDNVAVFGDLTLYPSSKVFISIEFLYLTLLTTWTNYQFIKYFFLALKNKTKQNKAMYFWLSGLLLFCFLIIYQSLDYGVFSTILEGSENSNVIKPSIRPIFQVILTLFDMWPFIVILLLALDIFRETSVFTRYELVLIPNTVKCFSIYNIIYFLFFIRFFLYDMSDTTTKLFCQISYIFYYLFLLFVIYVFARIFIVEKAITCLFFGQITLYKFQIGFLLLFLFLIFKMFLIITNNIPPINPLRTSVLDGNKESSQLFYCFSTILQKSLAYIFPFLCIALGASYSRRGDDDTDSPDNDEAETLNESEMESQYSNPLNKTLVD